MRLAAIFNAFGDCACLLPYAVDSIRPHVDEVVIVWSRVSNRGISLEYNLPQGCTLVQCEPREKNAHANEINKRNAGLEYVKKAGFTHFIMLDCDEFYTAEEIEQEKQRVYSQNLAGGVCHVKTYFKSPGLTIGYDHTLVPTIQKVTPQLEYRFKFTGYPFSHDRNGTAHIDPTRRLNVRKGVTMSSITMHHYPYSRKDIDLKIANSSANLRKSAEIIKEDLRNAKPGYLCKSYNRILEQCDNIFNLPELS